MRTFVSCFLLAATVAHAAAADGPPKFEEVYQIISSNLTGVSQAELDHAAVKGLLEQFPGQVMLVDSNNPAAPSAADTLSKVAIYSDSYAYFRISRVDGNIARYFRTAYEDMARTNKSRIKGVILDLRFAGGADYAAAAAVADCFLNSEQPLLDWGAGSAHATTKTNAITIPVAILVNSQTTGAAEALAAALREANVGLILGSPSAGQADTFKEFTLTDGEKLRVATAQIKLGDGTTLDHGLKPDIDVQTSLADERSSMENPYQVQHPEELAENDSSTNSGGAVANEPSHRPTNEAELVREHAAGETPDTDADDVVSQSPIPLEPVPPLITDAALARALDLLKGLAVMQQSHPG
jgi:carboxyl-terminal processing protease